MINLRYCNEHLWCFVFFFAGLNTSPLLGQQSDLDWKSHYQDLGDRFFDRGLFPDAEREYKRAFAYAVGDAPEIQYKLALSQYYDGEYGRALQTTEAGVLPFAMTPCKNLSDLSVARLCLNLRFTKLRALLALEQYGLAEQWAEKLKVESPLLNQLGISRPQLRLLQAYSALNQGQLILAMQEFRSLAKTHDPTGKVAAEVVATIAANPVYQYNPQAVGALSVIPGLGQIYTGHFKQGAVAFLLTSAAGYFAYEAWRKSKEVEGYGSGSTYGLGALFGLLYSGNIYNAASLAHHSSRASFDAMRLRTNGIGLTVILEQ